MMSKFRNVKNDFIKYSALRFFRNFISNHSGSINNNDAFSCMDELKSSAEFIRILKNSFSERKIKALQAHPCRGDRLDFDNEPKEMLREIWCDVPARKTLRKVIIGIIDEKLNIADFDLCKEKFPQRLDELQKTLQLSNFEKDILLVLILVADEVLNIEDGHSRRSNAADKITFIAKCLDCGLEEVLNSLNASRKLRRYNCVDNDIDFNSQLNNFLNGTATEPLVNSYFQKYKGEVLPWDFYGELTLKHGEILKEMIRAGQGKSPVNILLYGAPGTGKTSFAKTLAVELNLNCYCIAQNTNDNHGGRSCSTPDFRFGALQICDVQVDRACSVIIIDEADDMLRSGCGGIFSFLRDGNSGAVGDKGLLNSILDEVKTPTIWITNTRAGELDESSRRRFDYSIKFEPLNSTQRLAIWHNNIAKMKLGKLFDDTILKRVATKYAVSAGGITSVLKNMSKLKPQKENVLSLVDKLMTPHCELLNIKTVDEKMLPAKDYTLDGLNIKSDIQLSKIVGAVRNFQSDDDCTSPDCPRMNLLLSGAPGTGKTEFVKYLGESLNTKVVIKMGSDLLSMWVGGTEQNIKAAFAEAESEKAILFLDEIDGLLQSRERAQRNWEITQVNELLYQMENFKGVLIGATNFSTNLDAATLRRFTFKIEFDYLANSGKQLFFERMLGQTLSQEELVRLYAIPNLVPGDFRTVRQGMYYLGGELSNADYLAALEHESDVKQANKFSRKKIGF